MMATGAAGAEAGITNGQIYPDQMFNRTTADTSLTTMNAADTATQGPYTPKANGLLLKLIIFVTPQAATSLAQQWEIQFTCTAWKPINTLTVSGWGFGLATAPQAQNPPPLVLNTRLPINTALVISAKDLFTFSPVTPNLIVNGIFWADPSGKPPP